MHLEVRIPEAFISASIISDTKIHGKNLISKKILMQNFMHHIIDVNVNKYGVKTETSLRFWESKG